MKRNEEKKSFNINCNLCEKIIKDHHLEDF